MASRSSVTDAVAHSSGPRDGGRVGSRRRFARTTRLDEPPPGRRSIVAGPLRVLLAARGSDADSQAALAFLEQHLCQRPEVRCRRVGLDVVKAGRKGLVAADCVVLVGAGLRMAAHWSDLDVESVAVGRSLADDQRLLRVEPVGTVIDHPVLRAVRPFLARQGVGQCLVVPSGATCLLTGTTQFGDERKDVVEPVAWAWDNHQGRVFCTSLGCCVADYRERAIIQMLLNAVIWIGQGGGPLD